MWTLDEAVKLCAELWPVAQRAGYYVGLTGSVLWRGSSEKDLDLLVFPADTTTVNQQALRNGLRVFGFEQVYDRLTVMRRWAKLGSLDGKWVEVWEYQGKRVDLFFVQ